MPVITASAKSPLGGMSAMGKSLSQMRTQGPGLLAAPRSGGTTSPSKSELIGAARVILDNCGVQFSQNKIVRLVLQFLDRAPRANGHAFFLYLTNAVQMSAEQQQSALLNPDIARAIAYADPTGETAVNNVMRGRSIR